MSPKNSVPPHSPGLQRNDSLAEAGRKVMRFQFAEMLQHEDGTRLGQDIEALHDMRVASRRLRAAFDVFGEAFQAKLLKRHLKGLKATGRCLGAVRDLDVFMEKARRYLQTQPPEYQAGLDPLLEAWAAQREQARQAMLAHLDSRSYHQFKKDFATLVETPGAGSLKKSGITDPGSMEVRDIAPILIYQRLAAVRSYEACLGEASLEQLHALRIEIKKLRYTLEFFREVLGEETPPLITSLKRLQDHLGDLQDAQVAIGLVSQFLAQREQNEARQPAVERSSYEGVIHYLAFRHAERQQLLDNFQDVWQLFAQPEFRRNLALAIAGL